MYKSLSLMSSEAYITAKIDFIIGLLLLNLQYNNSTCSYLRQFISIIETALISKPFSPQRLSEKLSSSPGLGYT